MFQSQRVRLRVLSENHAVEAFEFEHDWEWLSTYETYPSQLYTLAELKEKFADLNKTSDKHFFAIEVLEDGKYRYIGRCGYKDYKAKDRRAEISIAIADKNYRGKGYGEETLNLLINFMIKELNLQKICLYAFANNKKAISLYEKLGFNEEGILKKHVFKNGEYVDLIHMGLFTNK